MSDPNCPYIDIFSLVYSVKDITLKEQFGRTYEIVRYQREHTQNYCMYEVNNGIRDGTAELFENGLLKLRWKMKNGMRDGDYVVYDKGMRIGEGRWKDYCDCTIEIVGSRWRKLIMIMRVNGAVNYEGEFNSLMQRDGMGFAYENGVLRQYGRWKGDEMVEEKQYFTSVTEMIEYANGSTSDLLTHRPVYVGGYQLDEQTGEMKRHGYGRVLNERSGICEYESEWILGEEVVSKRVLPCSDRYQHPSEEFISEREPKLSSSSQKDDPLSDQAFVESVHQLVDYYDSKYDTVLSSISEESFSLCSLLSSPNCLKEITLADHSYNDVHVRVLRIENMCKLTSLRVGAHSFRNVRYFQINEMEALESLIVGGYSFTLTTEGVTREQQSGVCSISSCPHLQSIEIGSYCFSDYHSFKVENLPALETLYLRNDTFVCTQCFSLQGYFFKSLS